MPRLTHEEVRAIGDVQLAYKYNMKFTKIPATVVGANQAELNARCQSFALPTKSITDITIELHGHKTHQDGKGVYSDNLEFVFYETVDNKVKEFMRTWRELCSATNTGATRKKSETEATILLELLGTEDQVIWTYEIIGSRYRDGTIGTMDSTSDDSIKPTLTITYDYFKDKKLV